MTQDTESLVLTAALRLAINARCRAPLANALKNDDIDWTRLVRLAQAHGLLPIIQRASENWGEGDAFPGDIRAALSQVTQDQKQHNETLARELLRIITCLAHAGIPAIPFKGPVFAATIYGDIAARRFWDLDILIREEHAGAALKQLNDLGYNGETLGSPGRDRHYRRYNGQVEMRHREQPWAVEPHWRFTPRTLAFELDYKAIWQRAQNVPFQGGTVLQLGDPDMALMLAIQGAKEGWPSLKNLVDFAQFVAVKPQLDWSHTIRLARQQGCERILAVALHLSSELLEPEVISRGLELLDDPHAETLAQSTWNKMMPGPGPQRSVFKFSSEALAYRERWQDRARYLWRMITTPRKPHMVMIALPDQLFFLYYPWKIIHDYLLAPVQRLAKPTPLSSLGAENHSAMHNTPHR